MPSTSRCESSKGRTRDSPVALTGAVDLEVQGYVEGEIAVDGDVTVDAHGLVGANVRGRNLLVRGAVRGDLVGDESVLLEAGARVVGDVRAPRVAIAPWPLPFAATSRRATSTSPASAEQAAGRRASGQRNCRP